jgi:ribonuclease E
MTDQAFPGDSLGDSQHSAFDGSSEGVDAPGQGSLAFGAGVENADGVPARKKRGARKRPARKKPARSAPAEDAASTEEPASQSDTDAPSDNRDTGDDSSDEPRKRTRRSRGGRKRSAAKARAAAAESEEPQSEGATEEAPASEEAPARKKRSRRRKPAAEKSNKDAPQETDEGAPAAEGDGDADDDGVRRKRRRGSRGGRGRKKAKAADPVSQAAPIDSIPGEEDDLPAIPDLPDDTEMLDGGAKRKRGRSSRKKKTTSSSVEKTTKQKASRSRATTKESSSAKPVVERTQTIIVNAVDREEKRVAVIEDGKIVDFLMTAESQKTLVSDIYRGKVVNLEPAIGAAFVDFGQGRNGFLHTSDVLAVYGEDGFTLDKLLTTTVDPDDVDEDSSAAGHEVDDTPDEDDEEGETAKTTKKKTAKKAKKATKARRTSTRGRARQRLPISDLIKVGSPVVTQVTKDAIGDKGPTLTTYISIPGRYLVLMPSMARTGVSRKIEDEKERRRLKRILQSIDVPDGMGVIVRTAGIGQTKTDLKRDLNYLLGLWENFGKRLRRGRGPMPLYQESDLAIRTLRDLFTSKTEAVIVDDPGVYDQLIEFANQLMPEEVDRIKLHDGDRPIFHHHGVEQEFEKIFTRRVELPCGGSVVFDQTEALVAIDVNSGRTRTETFDFEEIALKTNMDAVPEIARQIKLRDLGGIIVCDFIDMMRTSSMRQVERLLRNELAGDRARSKLGRISQFGLLELTRQRLGPGTHKKVFAACPRCRSTGHIRSVPSRAAAILRRLGSALTQKGFSSVELRAHPEVVEYLKNDLSDYVRALEHRFERTLTLTGVPEQAEDSVLRYLRADGREVRPGGRRRR